MLAMSVTTTGLDEKIKLLTSMPDIVSKVMIGAMSETVDDVHARQTAEMKRAFNNPTPYVLKGLRKNFPGGKFGKQSNKGRYGMGVMNAGTYFEFFPTGKSPEDIVRPHVYGGTRKMKRSEQRLQQYGPLLLSPFTAMGKDYPRNASGDIPGARYTQMLNQLGALSDVARSQMPKNKQQNRKGTSYFVMVRKGGKRGEPGIAIAERSGGQLKIMLVAARTSPYKKRFNYHEVGKKQLDYSLPLHISRLMNRYMSRL